MSDEQERTLDEITLDLGINHLVEKEAKEEKENGRSEFFAAATATLEKGILAQKVVEVSMAGALNESPEEWVAKWHPGWRVVEIKTEDSQNSSIQLEEDPSLLKFTYVNEEDDQVYCRNATQGVPQFDDDGLITDHPDLWKRISTPIDPPGLPLLVEYCEDHDQLKDMVSWIELARLKEDWPRIMIPLEDMSAADLLVVQQYLVAAPIKLVLLAPRAAKPEDESDG